MLNKFSNLIVIAFKKFSYYFVVYFLNLRDLIFILLMERIYFRKDIAELLIHFLEKNKRRNVMISASYYHKYKPRRNRAKKRVC